KHAKYAKERQAYSLSFLCELGAFAREIFRGEPAMTVSTTCPDPRRLQDLVDATLTPDEQQELSRHLDSCESCRRKLEVFVGGAEPWLAAVRELGEEPPVPATVVSQGLDVLDDESKTEGTTDFDCSLSFLKPSDQPG